MPTVPTSRSPSASAATTTDTVVGDEQPVLPVPTVRCRAHGNSTGSDITRLQTSEVPPSAVLIVQAAGELDRLADGPQLRRQRRVDDRSRRVAQVEGHGPAASDQATRILTRSHTYATPGEVNVVCTTRPVASS